jgi:hypothetical protein
LIGIGQLQSRCHAHHQGSRRSHGVETSLQRPLELDWLPAVLAGAAGGPSGVGINPVLEPALDLPRDLASIRQLNPGGAADREALPNSFPAVALAPGFGAGAAPPAIEIVSIVVLAARSALIRAQGPDRPKRSCSLGFGFARILSELGAKERVSVCSSQTEEHRRVDRCGLLTRQEGTGQNPVMGDRLHGVTAGAAHLRCKDMKISRDGAGTDDHRPHPDCGDHRCN